MEQIKEDEMKQVESVEEVYLRESVKPNQNFHVTIGREIELILLDFQKPIGEKVFGRTNFIIYSCKIIQKDSRPFDNRIYMVQIPSSVWCQLYEEIKKNNWLFAKNLHAKIWETTRFNYQVIVNGTLIGSI